jgi:hypothetical protein
MFFRHAFFALFGILKFDLAFGRKKNSLKNRFNNIFSGLFRVNLGRLCRSCLSRNFRRIALMADILPSYPPSLGPEPLSFLVSSLTDYCLSHGIAVRPLQASEGNHLASHAPVTLFPSLFPRQAWQAALEVQTTYNLLYAKIANDVEWLGRIMDELVTL